MPEPLLKFPVTRPDCALESVSELSIAVIATALLTGKGRADRTPAAPVKRS